jgi:hypothetical protein
VTVVWATPAVPARRRPTTWLAVGLLALALGMVGFMFASAILPGHEQLSIGAQDATDLIAIASSVAASLSLPVVGAILVVLRPRNPIGWILLVGGVSLILGDFTDAYVERSTIVGPDLPGYRLLDSLAPTVSGLAYPLLAVWLPLLFPDGRLPGPRWRIVGVVAAITTVALVTPKGSDGGVPGLIGGAATVTMGILLAVAVGAVVLRFRRADGAEREQLKWFVAGIVLLAASMLVLAMFQNTWSWSLLMLAFALLPIAIGIAVLRYRLYEIDRIISRTIGWALVTGILAAVFVGAVLALQALLTGFTQGETLAVAASTLVAFALFQPLRRRIQVAVDRRFDRARYDGQQTVDAFAERLRDQVELASIEREALTTVDETVRPVHAGLWLRYRQEARQ